MAYPTSLMGWTTMERLVSLILEASAYSVLSQLRRRMWPLDAEERRQLFELYCDLVSEHHYSPLPDGAQDS